MKTRRTFYRVVPNPSWSEIYAETFADAKKKLAEFGSCPKGTPENKAYWKAQQKKCKIVRVIEITEEIEFEENK